MHWCMLNASVPAIQIRDVPPDVRDALARDARARGQSLQTYLLTVLQRQTDAAQNAEFLRSWRPVRPRSSGGDIDIVELIGEQRRQRDRRTLGSLADESA